MNRNTFIIGCLVLLAFAANLFAQNQNSVQNNVQNNRPRLFVEESNSWKVSGSQGVYSTVRIPKDRDRDKDVKVSTGTSSSVSGGARPMTADIIKNFYRRCQDCVVTMDREKADYILRLEFDGSGRGIGGDNEFALFNKEGDVVTGGSTYRLTNAVKDVCKAIKRDWQTRPVSSPQPSSQSSSQSTNGANK